MHAHLYHLHAISALHCGTGQSIGAVDLPIARARATQLPIVPGSSLRGVLRDEWSTRDKALETVLFGPRNVAGGEDGHAGALAIGDAHLLVLPVRALAGIVAYATCPFVLKHYARDLVRCGVEAPAVPTVDENSAAHGDGCVNLIGEKVVLEDLDLLAERKSDVGPWAKRIAESIFADPAARNDLQDREAVFTDATARKDLQDRFVILSDTVFSYLAETATEVRTRIAIDPDTGTVKKGMLWTEENLPAESVLWGVYALSDSRAASDGRKAAALTAELQKHNEALLQLGGKAGIGRGLTRFLAGSTT